MSDVELILSARDELGEGPLWNVAERTSVFAEVDPNQKERIILALRKMGSKVTVAGPATMLPPSTTRSEWLILPNSCSCPQISSLVIKRSQPLR